ncbi:MAG: hypothetical protein GY716_02790, partial [bacterium]|nr:hypothetical protein [bacterium]
FDHDLLGPGAQCSTCHIDDFTMTLDPDHIAAAIPQDCEACHTTVAWIPATIDHDLLGPGSQCVTCHLADYASTTDPDHAAAAIPQDCEACHTTGAWVPATFDHDLLGPGTQCVTCHLAEYNATSDPDHAASGFPQDCDVCHGTNAWVPADFDDHDALYFPIFSGKHREEWSTCDECHTVRTDFSTFSCIDCHEHDDQGDVDRDHSEVTGYAYESQECYFCHPQGD